MYILALRMRFLVLDRVFLVLSRHLASNDRYPRLSYTGDKGNPPIESIYVKQRDIQRTTNNTSHGSKGVLGARRIDLSFDNRVLTSDHPNRSLSSTRLSPRSLM